MIIERQSDDHATLESVTNEQDNVVGDPSTCRAESELATDDVVDQQHTNTTNNSIDAGATTQATQQADPQTPEKPRERTTLNCGDQKSYNITS